MTIHRLSPERAQPAGQPFSVGVSFQHDLYDLGEAVFKTRAMQAFENAATRYAIHRRFRCAVRRELAEVFDDLALNTGLAPQRMNTVIEDADHIMQARSSGNQDLHRFLGIADGVVRAQGRKIIFTTNLPNIGDLDEALLRPGRCFGVVRGRSLDSDEIERLVARLCAGNVDSCKQAMARLLAAGSRTASVANVYRACNEVMGEALAR